MNSILVTGGAGFIGSHFIKSLLKNYPRINVYVLDALTYAGNLENFDMDVLQNPRFHFRYGNICNPDIVGGLMEQVDTVIHFAAESHVARSIYDNTIFYQTDVMGTHVIANQVLKNRKRIKRFLHISTSEVYGTAVEQPMSEKHPLNPMSPYASAKCGADRLVYSYWCTYGLPIVIVRPFNQYGPNQHLEKCIPHFITSALQDTPITVHGDGRAARDWVFVKDTCRALLAALEAPLDDVLGEVINLGTGIPADINTIAQHVLDLTEGTEASIEHVDDRPGQVSLHVSSTEKAKRLLGWQASTDLKSGLAKTIDWYRRNEDWWKRDWKNMNFTLPEKSLALH